MAFSTVSVSIDGFRQDAAPFYGKFRMRLARPVLVAGESAAVIPMQTQEVSFTGAEAALSVIPNSELGEGSYYEWFIYRRVDDMVVRDVLAASGVCVVPDRDCRLVDITDMPPTPETPATAQAYASEAKDAAAEAAASAAEAGTRAEGVVTEAIAGLADVARSGSYGDLLDKPAIPSLDSPAFTGTPTAPTAAPGTDSTQIATTAFVRGAVSALETTVSAKADAEDLTELAGTVSALETSVAAKADADDLTELAGTVSALETTVSAKADADDLTELAGTVSALETTVSAKAENDEVVHLTGSETISGTKTFSGGLMGTASAAGTNIVPDLGTVFTKTISANTTFTFGTSFGVNDAACITLILTNGGAYTVTWPSNVKWSGGEAPDLTASGVDILTFMTADSGTTWYGFLNGAGMA